MTASIQFEPITDTNPAPGFFWQYVVCNDAGECAAGSRHTVDRWFDLPWDFGKPTHFAKMPRVQMPKPLSPRCVRSPGGCEP